VNDPFREEPVEEAPPLLPSWNYWYALVLGVLIFLIAAFYLFSRITASL
jgi:ABC-type antimicrobial peptide transport system permease subunit